MPSTNLKHKIASSVGSILEWYDFALYGFFAPLLAQLFFRSQNMSIGMMKIFSVFAIGFFARPFGALLFGYIADKHGRTVVLKLTPWLITIPTLTFALLPTYNQIGNLAPISLMLIRILQGICVGGEYSNSIIYLCETTQHRHRYFIGSIGSCTGSFGIFLASSIAALCYYFFPQQELATWGWRLAFLLSLPIGVIAYIMRRGITESPEYNQLKQNKLIVKNPFIASCRNQWHDYAMALGLMFLPATSFYYVFMFIPAFLAERLGYQTGQILSESSITLFLRLLIIPIIGLIADKMGGIKIARISCILFLLLSFPLFYGLTHDKNLVGYCAFGFALLTTLNAASTPGLLVELLKPETRSTIMSFTFNVGFGIFGGLAPIISFTLSDTFSSNMASIIYLLLAALITLIATTYFKNRVNYG